MKKHALLITAYKNFPYLEFLAKWLIVDFDLYIHVDQHSKEITSKEIATLEELGCCVISDYSICWGGVNHVYAILNLMRIASKKEHGYYHIISAEDLLVKSYSEIRGTFDGNNRIFISCNDAVNDDLWNVRYRYFYPRNTDFRVRPYKQLNQLSLAAQKMFGVKRNAIGAESQVYKGYVYGSLPHDALNYVLVYVEEHPEFMHDLSRCLIPEEFFFQTILGNSPMKDRIAYNCMRYSVWDYKNGSIPGYLDESDWEPIINGDYLFARKVSFSVSSKLIDLAKERYEQDGTKGG